MSDFYILEKPDVIQEFFSNPHAFVLEENLITKRILIKDKQTTDTYYLKLNDLQEVEELKNLHDLIRRSFL